MKLIYPTDENIARIADLWKNPKSKAALPDENGAEIEIDFAKKNPQGSSLYGIDFSKIKSGEELLDYMFGKLRSGNKENITLHDVEAAVFLLDSIYSTQLSRFDKIFQLSEHLYRLIKDEDLLEKIEHPKDLPAIVDSISKRSGSDRKNYSFATKFCSRLNPEEFPIYDRYVDMLLKKYRGKIEERTNKKLTSFDLRKYEVFLSVYEDFRQAFDLHKTYKEIDMFIWTYGKVYEKENKIQKKQKIARGGKPRL